MQLVQKDACHFENDVSPVHVHPGLVIDSCNSKNCTAVVGDRSWLCVMSLAMCTKDRYGIQSTTLKTLVWIVTWDSVIEIFVLMVLTILPNSPETHVFQMILFYSTVAVPPVSIPVCLFGSSD